MKGDFSRNTFDPAKHNLRVLMQQGRVLLDSDWNEQTSLLLHYLQTLAADIIGPCGGPQGNDCGFQIVAAHGGRNFAPSELVEVSTDVPARPWRGGSTPPPIRGSMENNFWIAPGRYYVGGVLCENEAWATYAVVRGSEQFAQPDLLAAPLKDGFSYLVYLDVWERHVTAFEDDSIREVALGAQGPDTATRARVVWQVKTVDLETAQINLDGFNCDSILRDSPWGNLVEQWQPSQTERRGTLRAKAEEADDLDTYDPCITSPDARYRGAENQLYRVEVHRGGRAAKSPDAATQETATFIWSRENGSVVLPIRSVSGSQVTLERMGRDARSGVEVGDWVEIFDEHSTRRDSPTPLLRVTHVDPVEMTVTLSGEPNPAPAAGGQAAPMRNPLLRRWDHKAGNPSTGGLKLDEGDGAAYVIAGEDIWLELEDGIRIQFGQDGNYRAGDYWLIPARTATGDVEWPGEVGMPEARPPHGVTHYYAPLALIKVAGEVTVTDYRRQFGPLPWDCFNVGK